MKDIWAIIGQIVIGTLFVVFISYLMTLPSANERKIADEIIRLAAITPVVVMTTAEIGTYENGLKQAALGTTTQLTSWVISLKKAKKTGILPALPKDFTDHVIIWVGEKAILIRDSK